MDLPFEEGPSGQFIEDDFKVSGGVVVAGALAPLLDGDVKPALIFRFTSPFGVFYPPVLLVLDDDQASKLPQLVTDAVTAARKAAEEAS